MSACRAAILALTAALLAGGCGGDGDEPVDAGEARAAQRAAPYPLYWAGPSFAGLALTSVLRDEDVVTFSYGRCTPPPDEGGCAPPVSIQTSSICDRNALGLSVRPVATARARGAVVRDYGERRLELDTGASHVVTFASAANGRRVVSALRTVDGNRGERLAPARYPLEYVSELRGVRDAYVRTPSVRALRDELGISQPAVRLRLALARELGARRLRRPAADFKQDPGGCRLEPAR